MLYSIDKIEVRGVHYEVRVYLKRTRNLSYRITAQKISITIPDSYKNPQTIEKLRIEWLQYATDRIHSDKKLQNVVPFKKWDTIRLFGIQYPVLSNETILKNKYNKETNTFEIRPDIDQDKLKAIFAKFIMGKFEKNLISRVLKINQNTVNKELQSIEIKNHKSRWGSCSSKGEITISVNTLLAPLWVIDYVIIHELCHLVHMNHSVQFWQEVKKYYPKYKEAVNYLKAQGLNLSI